AAAQEGRTFTFKGFKRIHDEPGLNLWDQTTTLYITVFDGEDETAPVFGKGILHIDPADFARQMTTLKVNYGKDEAERLEYKVKFGEAFAGALFDVYGGIFRGYNYFDPNGPPRKRRPLRAPSPTLHEFQTEDGCQLRLLRYQAGEKGPVILSHGLGVSSLIFSIDTIDTNLVEFLCAHKYDVWLLDYRVSIELPAAKEQSSADEIAQYDYPAAVETVRNITGAETVQMLVHCYGATTWTMSMLGGHLQHVRNAVVSQVSVHAEPPLLTRIKAGAHVPGLAERLGFDHLDVDVDADSSLGDKLVDTLLRFYPIEREERTNNPVSRRITALYGQLYENDQLNHATDVNIHEMFGLANITSLKHLAMICRKKHVVALKGEDIYRPHLDRMAIPITFISGAENACFLPESTAKTVAALSEKNGK
ncbi:MAG: hypothetical protein AAF492_26600, partial [Verrucomicrobiota bacterium]